MFPGSQGVAPFQVFADTGISSSSSVAGVYASDTLSHVWTPKDMSTVSSIFMSAQNSEALQQGIRYRVNVESKGEHTIGRQSDTELAIIMRSVLLQYGTNLDCSSKEATLIQVRSLNARVLDFCVPRILEEIRAYEHYLADVSTLPIPMQHGQIASTKGERSLESRAFL